MPSTRAGTERRRQPAQRWWTAWVLGAVALLVAGVSAAQDPCARPVCRSGYHWDGEVCQGEPNWLGHRSHYRPERPLCPRGWRVEGENCIQEVCCEKPACRSDERYRDGDCHHGPSFLGYRSHRPAVCEEGWILLAERGTCWQRDCAGAPPPPARRAGAGDGPPRSRAGERRAPPPPARRAVPTDSTPARVTGFEPAGCVWKGARIAVRGARFGSQRRDRRVELGGHGLSVELDVTEWSDSRITVTIPNDPRLVDGEWYYVALKDGRGHWITNLSETITLCQRFE